MADMTPAEIEALLARVPDGYTPGPWETDERDHDAPYQPIDIRPAGRRHRQIARLWQDDAPVEDFNWEQVANADLIALAPELVAALRAQAAGYVPASEVQRARDEAFEQAACIADEHEFDMIAIIGKGKGEHGKPGYVTDSTWDAWLGKRSEASAIARRIRALATPPAQEEQA